MSPVETIPGMSGVGIKDNDAMMVEVSSTMICKNFY
jgi:hypothetical protein